MSIKITSPIEGYQGTGTYGPVTLGFTDGVAQVEELGDGLRAYLEGRGYVIDGAPAKKVKAAGKKTEAKPVDVPDGEPAEAWTHDQLDAYAAAKGVELKAGQAKAEKVAAILEAETAPEDEDVLGDDEPEG